MASVTAGVAVLGLLEGKKARREERRAASKREEQQKLDRRRQRQQALAEAAKRRSEIRAQAATQLGVGGQATAVTQAAGSITTQLNSNFGFASQLQQLEDQRTSSLNSAARYAGNVATLGTIGSVATSFATPTPPKV